jgi:Predicted periplasmic protein
MRVWFVSAVVWLCLLGSSASAKLTYTPLKLEDEITVLVIEGTFEFTDDLQPFLLAVIQHRPQAVTFHSGGGNVVKALELGRIIRRLNMMTVQTREYECSSACAFAFLGGVHRFATPGSIGVHKASFEGTPSINVEDAVASVQQLTAEVMSYIAEMGADPRLLELSLRYDKNDMRYLSVSEMQQYKVTTDDGQADQNVSSPLPSGSGSSSGTEIEVTVPVDTALPPVRRKNLTIPVVKEATVHHPKGEAPLNRKPVPKASVVAKLKNGKTVQILAAEGRGSRCAPVFLPSAICMKPGCTRMHTKRLSRRTGIFRSVAWLHMRRLSSMPCNGEMHRSTWRQTAGSLSLCRSFYLSQERTLHLRSSRPKSLYLMMPL